MSLLINSYYINYQLGGWDNVIKMKPWLLGLVCHWTLDVPGSNQEVLASHDCLSSSSCSSSSSLALNGVTRHLDQFASYSERLKRISV